MKENENEKRIAILVFFRCPVPAFPPGVSGSKWIVAAGF